MKPHRILFLCTGNSCRSQMAEAFVNNLPDGNWLAYSAGTHPTGFVHPKAVQALEEIGIQHQGRSKSVDEFQGQAFDWVITVCDSAAEECPVWLGPGRRLHLSFPDPAKASGSQAEVMRAFREVRDDIARQVPALLEKLSED